MNSLQDTLNKIGKSGSPFFFVIDFSATRFDIQPLDSLDKDILFDVNGRRNFTEPAVPPAAISYKKMSVPFSRYDNAFNFIQEHIKSGNTYLTNLTFPTELETDATLLDIFHTSRALFKLYYKNKFVTFSPERFITIENDCIKTFPMKGTIDATIPNAQQIIIDDKKELAEHITVVDLLRNDLSMVSEKVRVERFRYIDRVQAGSKELLQVSSEITGNLRKDWHDHIGDILVPLLPAGSICGAPKKKTVEIITEAEGYNRNFFTGIFGIYDGKRIESCVMIRFIDRNKDGLFFKSGGGITYDSNPESEYQEMIDKVYIPGQRNNATF